MQIILIGMPGSGKTTVGRLLARRLGSAFVDMDQEIEQKAGRTISDIFAKEGESAFREMETEMLRTVLKKADAVISTGGGIVTRAENRALLKTGDRVVFLDRPAEMIAGDVTVENRPLLSGGADRLYRLYAERYPLYQAAASVRIENTQDPETAVLAICRALGIGA